MSDAGWASPGRPDGEDVPAHGVEPGGESATESAGEDTPTPPGWSPPPGWSAQQPPAYPTPPVGAPGPGGAGGNGGAGPRSGPGSGQGAGQSWGGWRTDGSWGGAGDGSGSGSGSPPWSAGWGPSSGGGPSAGWGSSLDSGPSAAWGPAAGWQPDVKPGIIPLRPLGLGELLDGAIQAMRANPRVMLGLSAIVVTLSQAVQVLLVAIATRPLDTLAANEQISDAQLLRILASGGSALLLGGIITFVVQVILTGILTVVIGRAVLGHTMSAGDAWRTVRPRVFPLLGLTLLIGVMIAGVVLVGTVPAVLAALAGASAWLVAVIAILGFLAGVMAAIWLYVSLALASPALVLEKQRVIPAMRRSRTLVSNAWWRTFGILLLTAILVVAISAAVSLPFTALSFFFGGETGTSLPGLILSGLAGVVGGVITFPFAAGVTVLLYVDRRIRREGLDLELARAAGVTIPGRSTGPAPGQT